MKPVVAIIGKPNVGKSTMFNRLCGKRLAITDDRPGVTRDCKIHSASLVDLEFSLVDTAGLDKTKGVLIELMHNKSLEAVAQADIILFVVDARLGIDADDKDFARLVRKKNKKVILVINKSEGKKNIDLKDIYSFGFGEPVYVSAEHNQGFQDLYYAMKATLKAAQDLAKPDAAFVDAKGSQGYPLKLAIVGRPNVGKSTIFNCILGYNRSIVSDTAGTTRDAIQEYVEIDGKQIELIDTAGMRKKSNVQDRVESLSVVESINAIRRSHVVALVIDAQFPLEKQDLAIARLAIEEGRAMVLVVNKSDLIDDRKSYAAELAYLVEKHMFEVKGIPVVYVSAKNDKNIQGIFRAAFEVEATWQRELPTGKLNQWLENAIHTHLPPIAANNRRIRFKYITQTAKKPPTFTIFCNTAEGLPESYTRYLYNSLRKKFELGGVPIRIRYRKNVNPFQNNK